MMAGFWMTQAKNYVTRSDVSAMIQSESPYLVDKQLVLQNISEMKDVLKQNTQVISALNIEIARLRAELDKIGP
jgi:uncharacterized small protein (DUF1192 family)|tara:strand:- start:318 stop:539 length:222 start_codon:yes stop_codon:yes gene_type:complete